MVQHFTSLDGVNIRNTWLTIGSFDGIHVGHQQLIQELNKHAHQAGAKSVVLTFHPHPAVILRGRTGAFYLTTPSEKVRFLDELGIDFVITHPFTLELSQSSAREYVSYLLGHLGFRQLWVGYDFALGKGREGNVAYLQALGEEFKYQVHVVEPVMVDGRIASSSGIRSLITEGNITEANQLLGRFYRVDGEVVHGDGRGKRIGIPTANIDTGDEKLIPGAGVYACQVQVLNRLFPAAVNVGTRPTFENTDKKSHVEAHILDYSGDLYTQNISLEFIERLRGEEKYESVDDLLRQIYIDIEQTREILNNVNKK
jgi:riboflavin kinase/FMN adenylyltransferase